MGYWTDIIIRVNGSENDAKNIATLMISDTYRNKIKEISAKYEKEVIVRDRTQFGNSWSEKNEHITTFAYHKNFPFIYANPVIRELETGENEYWFTGAIKDDFALSYYLTLHELLKEGNYDFNGKVTWYWLGEQVEYVSDQTEVGYCEITKETIDFYFPYMEKGLLVEDEHIHLIQIPDYQDSIWSIMSENFGINDRCKDILKDVNDFNIRHKEDTSDTLIHEVQNFTLTMEEDYGVEHPELLFFAQLLMGPFVVIQDSIAKAGVAINGYYDYEDLIKAGWYTNTQGVPFFEFLKGITK